VHSKLVMTSDVFLPTFKEGTSTVYYHLATFVKWWLLRAMLFRLKMSLEPSVLLCVYRHHLLQKKNCRLFVYLRCHRHVCGTKPQCLALCTRNLKVVLWASWIGIPITYSTNHATFVHTYHCLPVAAEVFPSTLLYYFLPSIFHPVRCAHSLSSHIHFPYAVKR